MIAPAPRGGAGTRRLRTGARGAALPPGDGGPGRRGRARRCGAGPVGAGAGALPGDGPWGPRGRGAAEQGGQVRAGRGAAGRDGRGVIAGAGARRAEEREPARRRGRAGSAETSPVPAQGGGGGVQQRYRLSRAASPGGAAPVPPRFPSGEARGRAGAGGGRCCASR